MNSLPPPTGRAELQVSWQSTGPRPKQLISSGFVGGWKGYLPIYWQHSPPLPQFPLLQAVLVSSTIVLGIPIKVPLSEKEHASCWLFLETFLKDKICFSSIPGNCLAPLYVLQRVGETVASALWGIDESCEEEARGRKRQTEMPGWHVSRKAFLWSKAEQQKIRRTPPKLARTRSQGRQVLLWRGPRKGLRLT